MFTDFFAPPAEITPARRRAARLIAVGADALQLFLFPLFGEGFASPLDDVLDLAVALTLVKLLGFHWAFLPAAAKPTRRGSPTSRSPWLS